MSHEPMTQEQLNEIQGRLDASTWTPEEPWHTRWTWGGYGPNYVARCVDDEIVKVTGDLPSKEDSRLIAKAPTDLADLLADNERLRAENKQLRARLTVDDAMMERGARAFYEYPTPGLDASLRTDWDRLTKASPDVADNYRAHTRATLAAALGTEEEA